MKTHSLKIISTLAAILLATAAATAQMPGPDNVNVAITRLFGSVTAFSAATDVRVLDKTQKEWARTVMDFAVLDGKIRADVDMSRMKSTQLTPDALAYLKRLGLDRLASVVRPDKKTVYVIYPAIKSYVNMPMSDADAAASGADLQVEKTPLGSETVDGHACTKNHVVVKNSKGLAVVDATTRNASDLKDFPIQIATKENENTTIMHFRDIRLTRPEAKQFDAPAGYAAYPDPQTLMTIVAKKAMAEPAKK